MAKRSFINSGKLNFYEQFFPARPNKLFNKARKLIYRPMGIRQGFASASNARYIKWLRQESMLAQANTIAKRYSARGSMWQRPYAKPRPRTAVKIASVWYTSYGPSMVTRDNASILETLGDDELWSSFQKIGIDAIHTGPVKLAGGISGWENTPSVDGHFDRISNRIDPLFGTEAEFKNMSIVAQSHGGIIIDDIIPGHTGKGYDFRLAEMAYGEYPGIYHMVEIMHKDWSILPDVHAGKDSVNISPEVEVQLKERGYIIGRLPRVIFYEPGIKETNWSVTRAIKGVDGVTRRWVYLHYFKDGQPSINWLDPSFAGMKLVIGDALHSLGDLGSHALRLDANGFLGIEKGSEDQPAWSEGHPLSEAANLLISGMVRKVGGFTFQELNLAIDDIRTMSRAGADLSYDFVNRPAYHHALVTGDTEFLRLMLNTAKNLEVDAASLVHALQNHDDLTYELVHLWTLHKDEIFNFRGSQITGAKLRELIRLELSTALTGKKAPYNLPFTTNGIACTTVSVIAAVLGITELSNIQSNDIKKIKQIHLLLVMFNALQPGVFVLSGWDLIGATTIEASKVHDLIKDGDTRWINRGAYDLLGINPEANQSSAGIPLARSLYGNIKSQLSDDNSFASSLKKIIALRKDYEIDIAHQLDIPETSHTSMFVMVHQLPTDNLLQLTVLNFSGDEISGGVSSSFLPTGASVIDMFTSTEISSVDELSSFNIVLAPYQGMSLLIKKSD